MNLLMKRNRRLSGISESDQNEGELIGFPNTEASQEKQNHIDMKYLLKALVKYNASDLHIKVGRPPLYRVNGKLIPAKLSSLRHEQVMNIITGILTPDHLKELDENLSIDFSVRMGDIGRFRFNVYYQKGELSAVVRMVPMTVPRLDDLSVPKEIKNLVMRPRGLILVTGPTGSGKSTTLAAMIQEINENRPVHILTIEDPIEFVHRDQKASITQREIGMDVHSFEDALYSGLRQDPDVIVVGEMRDTKTIEMALTAAETGHLVLGTLHTRDARSTLERVLDVFPADTRNQIRVQLASSLQAIVSQNLMVRNDGTGRIPACELLVKSPAIAQEILCGDLNKISQLMESSNTYYKMQTMNQDLIRLVKSSSISMDEAVKISNSPEDLKLRLSGVSIEE